MIGGVGIAEEWTGDAQDPDHWRDTHVRVRGPVVRGLLGAFAENWLEATGEVLVGDAVPARASRRRGRRGDAGRAVTRGRGRHERRGAVLPGDRQRPARRSTSPPPTSRPGRRSSRRCATRRSAASRSGSSSPGRTSTSRSSARPGGAAYGQLLDCGVRHLGVPADDAPRQDPVPRRRVVVRRLGELRQPLVPAQRRGDALRQQRGASPPTWRPSSPATSRSPRRCPRTAGGAGRCGAARPRRSRASRGASSERPARR